MWTPKKLIILCACSVAGAIAMFAVIFYTETFMPAGGGAVTGFDFLPHLGDTTPGAEQALSPAPSPAPTSGGSSGGEASPPPTPTSSNQKWIPPGFKGPTGAPHVIGPTSPPPDY